MRVFKRFSWLEVGSGKAALSRPAHQRVTQAVGRFHKSFKRRKWKASYDKTAIDLDFPSACRSYQHNFNSGRGKFYRSLGLASLDTHLLGNYWSIGNLGRRKGIYPTMDEAC